MKIVIKFVLLMIVFISLLTISIVPKVLTLLWDWTPIDSEYFEAIENLSLNILNVKL